MFKSILQQGGKIQKRTSPGSTRLNKELRMVKRGFTRRYLRLIIEHKQNINIQEERQGGLKIHFAPKELQVVECDQQIGNIVRNSKNKLNYICVYMYIHTYIHIHLVYMLIYACINIHLYTYIHILLLLNCNQIVMVFDFNIRKVNLNLSESIQKF